jgi:hypothetical protein
MTEKVVMRSPDGEVREVEATVESLSPLMAHGWVQIEDTREEGLPHAGEHS